MAAGDSPGLSLRLDRRRRAELKVGARDCDRALAYQDLARLRPLLEAGRDVHRVAGNERAPDPRLADDDLARVNSNPQPKRVPEHLLERAAHGERRVQRAVGVVLLRDGGAESRHNRVADELLDRPPSLRDLGRHRVVKAGEERPRPFCILAAGHLRRANKVGEEHRGELALLARPLLRDRSGTVRAEARPAWQWCPATRTGCHARIFPSE